MVKAVQVTIRSQDLVVDEGPGRTNLRSRAKINLKGDASAGAVKQADAGGFTGYQLECSVEHG